MGTLVDNAADWLLSNASNPVGFALLILIQVPFMLAGGLLGKLVFNLLRRADGEPIKRFCRDDRRP
jgi:hypothetical protein